MHLRGVIIFKNYGFRHCSESVHRNMAWAVLRCFKELHHLHVIKLIYTMHDMLTIQYYLDLENYSESTEKAKNYMMEQVVMFIAYLIIIL